MNVNAKFLVFWITLGLLMAGVLLGLVRVEKKQQLRQPTKVHQQCNHKWVYEPLSFQCPKPKEVI